MLPASNRGVGMNLGFPDVCVTPVGPVPTPIPYPNMAMNAAAVPFAMTLYLSFVNALNMGSVIPMTLGDQPGTLSPFMGPGRYTMGNPVVNVEGLPAINLLCPTTGNNMINGLGAVVVPSVTNVFYSYADAAPSSAGAEIDAGGLRGLRGALAPGRPLEDEALLPGGLGYLALPVFALDVPARVHGAVGRLLAAGMEGLILDLRDNPGGDLLAAVELAGDFLDAGSVIATLRDAEGDETVHRARRERPHRFPLFLLVNRGTASAAELFAGALQAHGRAVLAGERTHGKGTALQVSPGPGGRGATCGVAATFTLPGGAPLHGVGLVPDLETPTPEVL